MSSNLSTAFEFYIKHQDLQYLETHIFTICNSYFHLLISGTFSLDHGKIIKKSLKNAEPMMKKAFEVYAENGQTEELITAISKILDVRISDSNHWDQVLGLLEDFDIYNSEELVKIE